MGEKSVLAASVPFIAARKQGRGLRIATGCGSPRGQGATSGDQYARNASGISFHRHRQNRRLMGLAPPSTSGLA
jgi:hypothetical protein